MTAIQYPCNCTQMADGPLAAALGRLPQLTAVQLGETPAGDATLEALTFAHRAASWAKTYGGRRSPDTLLPVPGHTTRCTGPRC